MKLVQILIQSIYDSSRGSLVACQISNAYPMMHSLKFSTNLILASPSANLSSKNMFILKRHMKIHMTLSTSMATTMIGRRHQLIQIAMIYTKVLQRVSGRLQVLSYLRSLLRYRITYHIMRYHIKKREKLSPKI